MKFRTSFAVTSALAVLAALTLAPATANAAPVATTAAPGQCSVGLVLPKTLAITGYTTPYGARMTGDLDCFFFATWDVSRGLISTGQTVGFFTPNTSGFASWVGTPQTVHALPRLGASSLKTYTDPVTGVQKTYTVVEQPSGTMTVKYDSRIAWRHSTRSGKSVTLRASAARFSATPSWQPGYTVWPKAVVRFQKLIHGTWHTVKSARTDAKGNVSTTVRRSRGIWRAVTVTTSTIWGKATSKHSA